MYNLDSFSLIGARKVETKNKNQLISIILHFHNFARSNATFNTLIINILLYCRSVLCSVRVQYFVILVYNLFVYRIHNSRKTRIDLYLWKKNLRSEEGSRVGQHMVVGNYGSKVRFCNRRAALADSDTRESQSFLALDCHRLAFCRWNYFSGIKVP